MQRFGIAFGLCVLALATPARPASAGILRWIDELSGPGPFKGTTAEVRVHCWYMDDEATLSGRRLQGISAKLPCLNPPKKNQRPRFALTIESGYLWGRRSPLRYERDGELRAGRHVDLVPIEATFYWQPKLGVELGVGGGVFVFKSGDFGTVSVPVIEPLRVDVRPFDLAFDAKDTGRLKNFLRMLTIRQAMVWLPGRIDAATFGAPINRNSFSERNEILPTIDLVIDLGAWKVFQP